MVSSHIKNANFKKYISDMVSIGYTYTMQPSVTDTVTETVTDTVPVTETVTETVTVSETENRYSNSDICGKPQKHKHGEFNHVLLTDDEYSRLIDDFGKDTAEQYIRKVDEYCEMKGKSYKNYNLAIRNTFMKRDGIKPIINNPNIDPLSGGHLDF